jgi:FKBP-type peptidyl-prolyl cis-trans isomerase 2
MDAMRSGLLALASAAALFAPAAAHAQDAEPARVSAGKRVSIEYTLTLDDGTVAGTTGEGPPLAYTHGDGELMRGIEQALEGMAVGESKQGMLEAKDAYGAIDARLFQTVDAVRIPEQDRKVGAKLIYREDGREPTIVRVHEVRGDRIVIDLNHPYAGSEVRYDVKVLKIE